MTTSVTYKVAKKMSQLGNARGFTVETLSAKSDVSKSTIRRILNTNIENYNPTLNTVTKLAKAFKMPLSHFMDFNPAHQ